MRTKNNQNVWQRNEKIGSKITCTIVLGCWCCFFTSRFDMLLLFCFFSALVSFFLHFNVLIFFSLFMFFARVFFVALLCCASFFVNTHTSWELKFLMYCLLTIISLFLPLLMMLLFWFRAVWMLLLKFAIVRAHLSMIHSWLWIIHGKKLVDHLKEEEQKNATN